MYASESLDCVSLNSVIVSELSDKEECSSTDISMPGVSCASKVSEGLGIDAF